MSVALFKDLLETSLQYLNFGLRTISLRPKSFRPFANKTTEQENLFLTFSRSSPTSSATTTKPECENHHATSNQIYSDYKSFVQSDQNAKSYLCSQEPNHLQIDEKATYKIQLKIKMQSAAAFQINFSCVSVLAKRPASFVHSKKHCCQTHLPHFPPRCFRQLHKKRKRPVASTTEQRANNSSFFHISLNSIHAIT